MGRFGDGVDVSADLALVFVSGGTPEQAAAAGERACALTGATATLGCSAGGIIGGGQPLDGEIDPVAGRSHLHGFTASVLVFP